MANFLIKAKIGRILGFSLFLGVFDLNFEVSEAPKMTSKVVLTVR